MTLIKFEPLREFENFQNKLQRFFGDFPTMGSEFGQAFTPRIDISEDEKHIYVEAEIPGVKKEEINISLEDNILTIKGEKKSQQEKEDKTYYRSERSYGTFTRSFTLPETINPDSVKANFENGILHIAMEKAKPAPKNERIIDIQ
jgi:HSP20 family protein